VNTWTHKDSDALYRGGRWKTFRKQYIDKHKPQECEGCDKPVSGFDLTLDHKIPLTKSNGEGAYDEANIVVLCRSCNSRKNNRLMLRQNYANDRLVSL
jgi:5-methylcytosine-specific restriction endonuclease McrA